MSIEGGLERLEQDMNTFATTEGFVNLLSGRNISVMQALIDVIKTQYPEVIDESNEKELQSALDSNKAISKEHAVFIVSLLQEAGINNSDIFFLILGILS